MKSIIFPEFVFLRHFLQENPEFPAHRIDGFFPTAAGAGYAARNAPSMGYTQGSGLRTQDRHPE
uniref:hypothetical protein n=1 Tax=Castellaniella defragrans TaxID=75697 RepID=UPI00334082C0